MKHFNLVFRFCLSGLVIVFLSVGIMPSEGEELNVIKQFRNVIQENIELRDRVEKLEKALAELQKKVEQPPLVSTAAVRSAPLASPTDTKAATVPKEKPALRSKNQIDVYGYIKLDAITDDSRTDLGNYARWVRSETTNPNDRQFSMTTHQTRWGFNFKGPDEGNMKTTGNLELELYGVGGSESKPTVGMRHAYFQFDWPNADVQLLLGQTWDLMFPQLPNTLNYSVGWWAGNLGIRHPQIRFTKGIKTTQNSKFLLQLAAVRPIGDIGPFTLIDSGFDSGSPIFQGRFAFQFPTYVKNKKAVIAFSGHKGKDEFDFAATGDSKRPSTDSHGFDWNIPLTSKFAFKCELWRCHNLDQFAGGIAQGTILTSASGTQTLRYVNPTAFSGRFLDIEALESRGGWLELNFGPFSKKWNFNAGVSVDNPSDDTLPDGARTHNSSRWFNAVYDLNDSVQFGLEFSRWKTDYKNQDSGTDNRIQSSGIYKF